MRSHSGSDRLSGSNHWARAAHHADPVAATRLGFVGRKPANLSSPFADLPSAMQMPCRLFSSAWQLFERSNYCVISGLLARPKRFRTPDPQICRRNFYVSGPNDFCKLPIYRTYEFNGLHGFCKPKGLGSQASAIVLSERRSR